MDRKVLPVGLQTFEDIRNKNLIYVDKTDLVFKLVNEFKFNFLSRPRRFGKSILVSTVESYFKGQADLFKGLKIDSLEKDWIKYPVFHFDLNITEQIDKDAFYNKDGVYNIINSQLLPYEKEYGVVPSSEEIGIRFSELIRAAYEQKKQEVVILIDEYEKPILGALHEPELQECHRKYLKSFYGVLKTCEKYIRFALLTGVTRMGQLSVFSDLNNLRNISLDPEYASICGFTEKEIIDKFSEFITGLSKVFNWDIDYTIDQLREKYDGYRFTREDIKVYNPFSLLNCFADQALTDYWFNSGTPSFLVEILRRHKFELQKLEGIKVNRRLLTEVDDNFSDPIPLLYQSGYLTIIGYEMLKRQELYKLDYPNEEVRLGFYDSLLANYCQKASSEVSTILDTIVEDAQNGNVKDILVQIESIISSVPDSPREKYEYFYRDCIYLIFKLLGFKPQCEVHILTGRTDCVMEAEKYIYLFEFKVDETPEKALEQIEEKRYYAPYLGSHKRIFKIGVNFDSSTKKISSEIK